jgi:hypothetical protein
LADLTHVDENYGPHLIALVSAPLVYRSFNVTGTSNESSMAATFFEGPLYHENRLMENDVIVDFP